MDSLFNKVNMTNCYRQCQQFFEKYESIDCNLLVAYWMMAGYLDPVQSVQQGYAKGQEMLKKLTPERLLNLNQCKHEALCTTGDLDFADFLDLHQIGKVTLTNGMLKDEKGSLLLIDGDDLSSSRQKLITSCKGLKYVACFDQTHDSVKVVLETVDNPTLLLLRGYSSLVITLPFEKLKNLTVLEISGSSCGIHEGSFWGIPENIFSELTQLQFLNLSLGVMEKLPKQWFSGLKQLRCLILRGYKLDILPTLEDLTNLEVLDLSHCSSLCKMTSNRISSPKLQMVDLYGTKLTSIPQLETTKLTHLLLARSVLRLYRKEEIKHPSSLQVLNLSWSSKLGKVDLSLHKDLIVLDLSRTKITSIDSVSDMFHLRKLILKFCSCLQELPSLEKLESLEVFDLWSCELLTQLPDLSNLKKLEKLRLDGTQVSSLPSFANPSHLLELSLKGLTLDSLENLASLSSLVKLNLSQVKISSSEEFKVDFLQSLKNLQILDISGTNVAELSGLAKLTNLKELLLTGCKHLNTLPDLKNVTNVERLELDGRGDAKLVLTKTSPVKMSNDNKSNALWPLNFDAERFTELFDLISRIWALNAAPAATTATNIKNEAYKKQLELLRMDVEYIKQHIDRLESSLDRNRANDLLQYLFDVVKSSEEEFAPDSFKFQQEFAPDSFKVQQLFRTVAKLKLLVPRNSESYKKESQYITHMDKKNVADGIAKELASLKIPQVDTVNLLNSYKSLTESQKQCLLCFTVFHCNVDKHTGDLIWKGLEIKKKILIYWWVGEGFIDLCSQENAATEVSEQVTLAETGEENKTVDEIGEQILQVLTEKSFIEPVIEKGRTTGRYRMHPFVHSFVTEQAKNIDFFDFNIKNGKLKSSFTRSRRACLLKSHNSLLSSRHLWEKYNKSGTRLKRLDTVRTLFNVNESIINIQPECFSKMENLSVLHLGNWQCGTAEHIEVGDQKFLKGLKNMKQLKLFSLQGVLTIAKLPDSVCKVSSLRILNLRECHSLEEIPAEIGSLKNLTHLDITNCHLLSKLPKGISLLSKLEVLKGLVIYDQPGDPQDKKASILNHWSWKAAKGHLIHELLHFKNDEVCTLRDLSKLENLRELSIVVNNENFPDDEELKVFKEMENLRMLMISWQRSFKDEYKNVSRGETGTDQGDNEAPGEYQGDIEAPKVDQGEDRASEEDQGDNKEPEDSSNTCGRPTLCKEPQSKNLSVGRVGPKAQKVAGQEAFAAGKCLELMKCCMQQSNQKDREKKARRENLDHIKKLELWCFPRETTPDWLVSSQLKNLQKLYVRGGKLKTLPGGTNGNEWKVETLRLKYLSNMVFTWTELKAKFPQVTYLEMYKCKKLHPFPCDYQGVWGVEYELPRECRHNTM